MATPSRSLVDALRATAARVEGGADYQWGHYGHCNCGHLAQTLTGRSAHELQRLATARSGEWQEQAREFCPTSGAPLGDVISDMLRAGLALEDVIALETLSDPAVLARVPDTRRWLQRNERADLVLYLRTWGELLEEQLEKSGVGMGASAS